MSYANIHARTRNTVHMNQTAIATPMTVPEGAGLIAVGNSIHERNIN